MAYHLPANPKIDRTHAADCNTALFTLMGLGYSSLQSGVAGSIAVLGKIGFWQCGPPLCRWWSHILEMCHYFLWWENLFIITFFYFIINCYPLVVFSSMLHLHSTVGIYPLPPYCCITCHLGVKYHLAETPVWAVMEDIHIVTQLFFTFSIWCSVHTCILFLSGINYSLTE